MSLSPDQIAKRIEGISASDVSSIVGVNPWRSAIDVWRIKRGDVIDSGDPNRSRWGELLEPVVRADYATRNGLHVEVPGTLQNGWMIATPDGIAYRRAEERPERGLEIKCHTWRYAFAYGAPGSDEIPLWELCQCVWGMAVTGLARWDLCAFIDGQPTDYRIMRDEELIASITEQCERFLIDHVRADVPPPPDGSASYSSWLTANWPSNSDQLIDIGDDNETFSLIERGKEIRRAASDIEDEHNQIMQKLKAKIGEQAGLTWKNAAGKPEKITWKRNKSSVQIDLAGYVADVQRIASLTVSARRPEVERATTCLRSLGEHTYVGHSSQAVITAGEIVDALDTLQATLTEIAARKPTKIEVKGNRPFVWPKNWKAPKSAKED